MTNRIIVKIWTESLEGFETSKKVETLIEGIIEKHTNKIPVLLVSSGSVQFGREALSRTKSPDENKPLLASIWWDILMSSYRAKFARYQKNIAGILVTHADIEDNLSRRDRLKRTILSAWEEGIIPIVNENDALCIEELDALKRGWDNDRNALLLARMFDSRQLILTTNTNGVYSNRDDPDSRITEMKSSILTASYIEQICSEKSETGTGGMQSKLNVAHEAGKVGIATHIGNGIDSWIHDMYWAGTNIWPYTDLSL